MQVLLTSACTIAILLALLNLKVSTTERYPEVLTDDEKLVLNNLMTDYLVTLLKAQVTQEIQESQQNAKTNWKSNEDFLLLFQNRKKQCLLK